MTITKERIDRAFNKYQKKETEDLKLKSIQEKKKTLMEKVNKINNTKIKPRASTVEYL